MLRALSVSVLGMLVGCQALPRFNPSGTTAHSEALAGVPVAPSVEHRFGGVVRDVEAELRMADIGRRLASRSAGLRGAYRFRLLSAQRPNAISLPGGSVYVTRGLYTKLRGDRLLAAALAHELAHIAFEDSLKPRCRNLEEALRREIAADARAARYLEAAGISPAALIDLVLLIGDQQPAGWAEARAGSLADHLSDSDISSEFAQATH